MFTSVLSNYEKAILKVEGLLDFYLTTIIAITAMLNLLQHLPCVLPPPSSYII